MENKKSSPEGTTPCMTRRNFILSTSGMAVTSIFLSSIPGISGKVEAQVAKYPSKKVGSLKALKVDEPTMIFYPYDDLNSLCFMVKLGVPAGGGVGPDKDIVAFHTLCTHMGGDLSDLGKTYIKEYKILGPCPLHLTTFDLTRHGMLVAGHATESLPQVLLETKGDDILATGIMGLIYGMRDSLDKVEL